MISKWFFRAGRSTLAALLPALLFTGSAFAHHPMGGETPTTFIQGLLSGLGHPVIGFDHFTFILGLGLASALLGGRLLLPFAFVAATVAGAALQLQGVALPFAEIVIAGSVFLIGALLMSKARIAMPAYLALFAIAGVFHGWAYGESIVGAEQTPLTAYLLGFAAVQLAIAWGVMAAARAAWSSESASPFRLAGGVVAGVGLAFFIENVEKLIFPGLI